MLYYIIKSNEFIQNYVQYNIIYYTGQFAERRKFNVRYLFIKIVNSTLMFHKTQKKFTLTCLYYA